MGPGVTQPAPSRRTKLMRPRFVQLCARAGRAQALGPFGHGVDRTSSGAGGQATLPLPTSGCEFPTWLVLALPVDPAGRGRFLLNRFPEEAFGYTCSSARPLHRFDRRAAKLWRTRVPRRSTSKSRCLARIYILNLAIVLSDPALAGVSSGRSSSVARASTELAHERRPSGIGAIAACGKVTEWPPSRCRGARE